MDLFGLTQLTHRHWSMTMSLTNLQVKIQMFDWGQILGCQFKELLDAWGSDLQGLYIQGSQSMELSFTGPFFKALAASGCHSKGLWIRGCDLRAEFSML